MKKIAVVGGGITGLTCAYKLASAGYKVILLEAEKEVGGLAGVIKIDNFYLAKYYHHFFRSDKEALKLLQELSLKLNWLPSQVGIWLGGKAYKFSTPKDLLKFSPFSLRDKWKFGLGVIKARFIKEWLPLEEKTSQEWLTEIMGDRAYKIIWEPLLRSKFGSVYSNISASWIWGKIKLRGSSRSSCTQQEELGYLEGSLVRLLDKLVDKIKSNGGEVKTNWEVKEISKVEDKFVLTSNNEKLSDINKVIVTTSPAILSRKAPFLPSEYKKQLESISYQGVICMLIETDTSLSSIYWLNIAEENFPFGGIIEQTNFIHPDNYGGRKFLYISRYISTSDEMWEKSATELLDLFLPYLKEINPNFNRKNILNYYLFKDAYAQPVVEKFYSRKILPFSTPFDGLYLVSMCQIYPQDRGVNYAVELAGKFLKDFTSQIKQ